VSVCATAGEDALLLDLTLERFQVREVAVARAVKLELLERIKFDHGTGDLAPLPPGRGRARPCAARTPPGPAGGGSRRTRPPTFVSYSSKPPTSALETTFRRRTEPPVLCLRTEGSSPTWCSFLGRFEPRE
jgi:hypothetical protein